MRDFIDRAQKCFMRKEVKIGLLVMIILVGIFFRAYHFREWLHFGSDQSRDALIIENAATGVTNWPLLGAEASNTRFQLGPMHYYFQIISDKLFGTDFQVPAYPDLLFSILAIPLLFIFLKRYFTEGVSLALTGLFSVSYYVIEYSRFAWNPNPIPFFVLLFFLLLLEFFKAKEQTGWGMVLALGALIGISVQLHTILLFLFPLMTIALFCFFVWKRWKLGFKWIAIPVVVIILNSSMIVSDIRTGGVNVQFFLNAFVDRSSSGSSRLMGNIGLNALCHAQANGHILSSLGERGVCNYYSVLSHPKKFIGTPARVLATVGIVGSLLFSIVGYGALMYLARKEDDEMKRYFLWLVLLYIALSFGVMLSAIRGAPLRYFIHEEIIPFILLGAIMKLLLEKYSRAVSWSIISVAGVFFVTTNLFSVVGEAKELSQGMRGNSGFAVLEQEERMVEYMKAHSVSPKRAFLFGSTKYGPTYRKPLQYIASKQGFELILLADRKNLGDVGETTFFLSSPDLAEQGKEFDLKGYVLEGHESFGELGLYKLGRVSE